MLARISLSLVSMIGLATVSADDTGSKKSNFLEGLSPLTSKRIPMKRVVVTRCAIDAILQASPHHSADMVVHANKLLTDYIRAHPEGVDFPVGSVLVKEKFPSNQPQAKAILFTRMERTSNKGDVGDWEFSAKTVGDGETEGSARELTKCATCHEEFEDTGFVSEKTVGLLRAYAVRSK